MTETPATIPGFVRLSCRRCNGGGEEWDEGVSLLQSVLTGEHRREGRPVLCSACRGRGWDRTVYVGEPPLLMLTKADALLDELLNEENPATPKGSVS